MSQAVDAPASQWSRRHRPGGWTSADAALAALCLVALGEEVLFGDDVAPRAPLLAAAALVSLPVAWRQARPGAAAGLSCGGFLLTSLVSTGPFPPQLAVLPVLLLLFGAAARLRGLATVVWGAVTLVLMVAAHTVTPDGDLFDFWPWLLWGGAWVAGTFVRRRTDTAARHAARAALLEVEATTSAADSAVRERDRIARELHDVVAHAVSVMVVQAGAERLRLGAEAGETGRVLASIEDSGRQALSELRTMLGVLRDADEGSEALFPLPGLPDLPVLVERLRATGLDVRLVAEPDGVLEPSADLPGAVELAAYRIVQESLTNVVRHVGLVQTCIRLRDTGQALEVEVCNEGSPPSGPAGDAPGGGRGLVGMRERADAVGGTVTAEPVAGGFVVRAVLPLAHDRSETRR